MDSALIDSPTDPAAPVDAPAAAGGSLVSRRRKRFRGLLRWSALARNVFGATKDLGIILVVVGLLFFNEEVIDYLDDHGIGFADKAHDIDVAKELSRLNSSANTLSEVADPAQRVAGKKAQKATRAERRLLRSGEAEYISDWALIVASQKELALAQKFADTNKSGASRPVSIYKKKAFRLVVPVDGSDNLPRTIATLRSKFPGALLVSLSSWCPNPSKEGETWVCA